MLMRTGGRVSLGMLLVMTAVGWRLSRTAGSAEAVAETLGVREKRSHGDEHEHSNPARAHYYIHSSTKLS